MRYLKNIRIWILFAFLLVCGTVADFLLIRVEEGRLERAEYGEEEIISLIVHPDDADFQKEIEMELPTRKLTEEEVSLLFEQAKEEIDRALYADEDSALHVSQNLTFLTKCCKDRVRVSWTTSDYELVGIDGEINSAQISEEGQDVQLIAEMRYEKYRQEYVISCHLVVPLYTEEERFEQKLKEEIEFAKVEEGTDFLQLPTNIDGTKLFWRKKCEYYGVKIFLFEVVIIILLFYLDKEKKQQAWQLRKKQLTLDYPEIVSKIKILLGAGMSDKRALEIISASYLNKRNKNQIEMRAAYEELVQLYHDLEKGISKPECYRNFAIRCGMTNYYRLARILTEHLLKGNSGVMAQLEDAVEEAFEERAANAKKLGEEANTKLLLPLLLMMGIVMAIVIVPAFMGMKI